MENFQRKIFKVSTSRLKRYKWNMELSLKEAARLEEIVPLFDGQVFRLVEQIIEKKKGKIFTEYLLAVKVDKKMDFDRAVSKKGVVINGIKYKRFVGTTGGLKSNVILLCNEQILPELNRRCDCGRDQTVPLLPAKYEAYKSLTCSASVEILSPKKILVVSDCITTFRDTVVNIDDTIGTEPEVQILEDCELQNNVSDGFNLCTIEFMQKITEKLGLSYIPSGVCLRNAFLKGMLYPFPIKEYADKFGDGNYIINDIWGNPVDIREVEMILTESSLKLWNCYESIEDYINNYKSHGYEFSVTKIAPEKLEDERELNYQYLQSYELSDADIAELVDPTIQWLKNALCGDYESMLEFLGIDDHTSSLDYSQALFIDKRMMYDPYVIDRTNKMIKKKINNAKIGKLRVHGNYQIASGDPFALMQHIFGHTVTGLLKSHEVYSKYWIDENVTEVVCFRSPMTSHNNIRKMNVSQTEDAKYWYQYMTNIMIINGWDTFCMAENGCDYD